MVSGNRLLSTKHQVLLEVPLIPENKEFLGIGSTPAAPSNTRGKHIRNHDRLGWKYMKNMKFFLICLLRFLDLKTSTNFLGWVCKCRVSHLVDTIKKRHKKLRPHDKWMFPVSHLRGLQSSRYSYKVLIFAQRKVTCVTEPHNELPRSFATNDRRWNLGFTSCNCHYQALGVRLYGNSRLR